MKEEIFIASDHAGFKTKEKIKKFLDKKNIKYKDIGPNKIDINDDYPDYAFKVAEKVTKSKNAKGILICGSGSGMVIAANKIKGIRAVVAYDIYSAKMSRKDNDANILGLRGKNFNFAKMKPIIMTWLKTPFSNKKKHIRRINKIKEYEK